MSHPDLDVVAKDRELLVIFPMGTFPQAHPGEPKPRLGIGLEGKLPAIFQLATTGDLRDAKCVGLLPVDGIETYTACKKILGAEADLATGAVVDHGWFGAKSLFEAHLQIMHEGG